MKPIKGILVLSLNESMYSNADADGLVKALLRNGYTVTLKHVDTMLYVEYTSEISDEASLMFPLK